MTCSYLRSLFIPSAKLFVSDWISTETEIREKSHSHFQTPKHWIEKQKKNPHKKGLNWKSIGTNRFATMTRWKQRMESVRTKTNLICVRCDPRAVKGLAQSEPNIVPCQQKRIAKGSKWSGGHLARLSDNDSHIVEPNRNGRVPFLTSIKSKSLSGEWFCLLLERTF